MAAVSVAMPVTFELLEDNKGVEFTVAGVPAGSCVGLFRANDMEQLSVGYVDDQGMYKDTLRLYKPTEVLIRVRHKDYRFMESVETIGPEPAVFFKSITLVEDMIY